MLSTSAHKGYEPRRCSSLGLARTSEPQIQPLDNRHHEEVLEFLSLRPIHTVSMASLIRDNGIVSPLNRGSFYGCRDTDGALQGVALIGHATLFETRSFAALKAFADLTRVNKNTHMMMGELARIEEFWHRYSSNDISPRLRCRELLFEQRWPIELHKPCDNLRIATQDDLESILPIQASLAEAESGVNPLAFDAEGFRARCARRIELGRTWVAFENEQLIFKADVQSETESVAYLEGIYVAPEARGKSTGKRYLSQVSRDLLQRVDSICLLVNETNSQAHALYRAAGYKLVSIYDTIFV
jgi:GNAT superfamily N-acetyltransferase